MNAEKKNLKNTPDYVITAEDMIKCFGIILAITPNGKVISRPIGGGWENGIRGAVSEVEKLYPGSKIKMFFDDAKKKHWDGIIPQEQVIVCWTENKIHTWGDLCG